MITLRDLIERVGPLAEAVAEQASDFKGAKTAQNRALESLLVQVVARAKPAQPAHASRTPERVRGLHLGCEVVLNEIGEFYVGQAKVAPDRVLRLMSLEQVVEALLKALDGQLSGKLSQRISEIERNIAKLRAISVLLGVE